MKKFIFGFISGVIVSVGVLMYIQYMNNSKDNLQFYEDPKMAHCLKIKQLKVFQVLGPNTALAQENLNIDGLNLAIPYFSDTVLLIGPEGYQFYDNEVIIPKNKQCVKQRGTYQYKSRDGEYHTVPAVVIE